MAIALYIQDLRTGHEEEVTETCLDCECRNWEGQLVTRENLDEQNVAYLMDTAFATARSRFGHDDIDVYTKEVASS